MQKIAIIGGSGLDNPNLFIENEVLNINTPFGKTSSPINRGEIGSKEIYLLARHGHGHNIPPTQVNNKANIWALKELGVEAILATTAVGSLQAVIKRGDLVVLDQFIDFTRKRDLSFFESFETGKMQHTPMAEPFDKNLRAHLIDECTKLAYAFHSEGTVVTIEGPRFSTKAESKMFKAWGADVINMSIAPECILANEIGLPYAAVAMSTDYDSWKENETPVSWEEVVKVFELNVEKVTKLLVNTIERI
jgi:5'-methylthioadenosine phosphorylase